jgi:hypothetical protein
MLVGSCAGAAIGLLTLPQADDRRVKFHGLILAAGWIAAGTVLGLALGVVWEVRAAPKPEAAGESLVSVAALVRALQAATAFACVGAFHAWSLAGLVSVAAATTRGD